MPLIQFNYGSKSTQNSKPAKKKAGVMNVALIILLIVTFGFTAVMIYLFMQYQAVPDTLITCFFTAVCGECGILGWMKTSKEKHKKNDTGE